MQVLKDFSENQRNYLLYQSRREAIIKENTIIKRYEEKAEELKKALKEKKKAFKDREDAFKEKEKAFKDREDAFKEKKKAFKEKEDVLKEKKKADEKIKSLMMLLKEKGIEIPDER
ncbi:Uncharacterized protein dnl_51990 [Desulfonema limicola]|uniref:Uncharacterized protein n=1 Tax=Desulfonema limicola TaxID=45656 RepID=A0A975GIP7_9BACT|nr:Uncharacterized protein dnl_51990 [Desulfonema limicola]